MGFDPTDFDDRTRKAMGCAIPTKPPRAARSTGAKSKAKAAKLAEARAARTAADVTVTLPIRTVNPLNNRAHWSIVSRRSRAERSTTLMHLRTATATFPPLPVVVTLTRLSRGEMDGDGLQASFKAVRDGVADAYGCGDGSRSGLTFRYAQEKAKAFGVRIHIAVAPVPPDAEMGARQ